jgi:transcriptional regulator with XRE-family HTH domain
MNVYSGGMTYPGGGVESDEVAEAFGQFLLSQRRFANISQRQLAKASGISDSYLSQLERGIYRPSAEVLKTLAKALGIPATVLYAQFGLLDEGADSSVSVADAVRRDPELTEEDKKTLLRVYDALRCKRPADQASA